MAKTKAPAKKEEKKATTVVVAPTAPKPAKAPAKSTPAKAPAKAPAKSTSKAPAKSTSKKTTDPYAKAKKDALAAEKRAIKRETDAKKAAGKRFIEGADNLQKQAAAIRQALDVDFASNRDTKLASIALALNEQVGLLQSGHRKRADEFLNAASDTTKAAGDTAERGLTNAVREHQDTLSSILEQGAGETDTMKAMLMSARNWNANAAENNRSYFDSMQSVNAGITDLNVDTRTELARSYGGAEADKERVWQDFYNRRGEAFTQLGNILGQQADYYAQAKEMGVKPKKGVEKTAEDGMSQAFKDSAVEAGKSYTNQGLPEWVSGFTGQDRLQARQSNTELAAALTMDKMAKAEGATLRKWDAA